MDQSCELIFSHFCLFWNQLFANRFFLFCSRFQFFWVPEDGPTDCKCAVSFQPREAPECSAANARATLGERAHSERVLMPSSEGALENVLHCVCDFVHTGEAVVWQSWPPANRQRASGCRAPSAAWRTAQERICQNILPPRPQVQQQRVPRVIHSRGFRLKPCDLFTYAATRANGGRKQWRRPASPNGTRRLSTLTSIVGIFATTCWSWLYGTNPGHQRKTASSWERYLMIHPFLIYLGFLLKGGFTFFCEHVWHLNPQLSYIISSGSQNSSWSDKQSRLVDLNDAQLLQGEHAVSNRHVLICNDHIHTLTEGDETKQDRTPKVKHAHTYYSWLESGSVTLLTGNKFSCFTLCVWWTGGNVHSSAFPLLD